MAFLPLAGREAYSAPPAVANPPAAAKSPAPAEPAVSDDALARAEAYVAHSDKYMHHSKLHRGMKGYGLTVMAGTKIEKFDAEIVSVMSKFGPHQDVILATLSGLGLEKSGIIAGMSGSPVYMKDTDGKYKMIGAVAYGWPGPKEPLCGIQPITQMLAVNGVLDNPAAKPVLVQAELPGGQSPAGGSAAAGKPASPSSELTAGKPASRSYLQRFLNPAKIDFVEAGQKKGLSKSRMSPRMFPLKTPLMVSGMSEDSLGGAEDLLAGGGVMLVQSGGAGAAEAAEYRHTKLEPGSGIAIPLVSGDAEFSAVGTVTEVIGDRVLAFGHSFFAQGEIDMPMGPAYIHTVVSGVMDSFKLGSTIQSDPAQRDSVAVGSLWRDETTGIAGRIGSKVSTIPMTVCVDRKDAGESRLFHYNVVRHPFYTPLLVFMMAKEGCTGWYELPKEHTLHYQIDVDFGKAGKYHADNISSNNNVQDLASDLIRPIAAVMENPWSKPPEILSVNVHITVEPKSRVAEILELKLDSHVYRPGETIKGSLVIDPYRQARQSKPIAFELPADLPEGTYQLTVCNSTNCLHEMQSEMPQRFEPHAISELMDSLACVAAAKTDQLYLRLQLPEGGLSIKRNELPNLPASKMLILAQDQKSEMFQFTKSLVRSVKGDFVFNGSAVASFEVKLQPRESLTRDQRKPE
jgi:hypothetical protein